MDGRSVVVVGYPGAELLDIACITTALERVRGPLDTVVVSGGLGSRGRRSRRPARGARPAVGPGEPAGGVALVLAAAGLLDGRRVTTHRLWAARLARRHPAVHVDPAPIFVRDGPVSRTTEAIWPGWWPAA